MLGLIARADSRAGLFDHEDLAAAVTEDAPSLPARLSAAASTRRPDPAHRAHPRSASWDQGRFMQVSCFRSTPPWLTKRPLRKSRLLPRAARRPPRPTGAANPRAPAHPRLLRVRRPRRPRSAPGLRPP